MSAAPSRIKVHFHESGKPLPPGIRVIEELGVAHAYGLTGRGARRHFEREIKGIILNQEPLPLPLRNPRGSRSKKSTTRAFLIAGCWGERTLWSLGAKEMIGHVQVVEAREEGALAELETREITC